MQGRTLPYRFGLRVLAFVAALTALFALVDRTTPRWPPIWLARLLPELPEDLARLRSADGKPLFLGDSVLHTAAMNEPDRRNLVRMLAKELETDIVRVSHGASGMDRYLAQVRYLLRAGVRPSSLVVLVNPRTFGPTAERNPSWSFALTNRMYTRPLLSRLQAVLKWDFGIPDEDEFLATEIRIGETVLGPLGALTRPGLEDPPDDVIRNRYLSRYATDIRTSSRLRDLAALARLTADAELPTLFYITPIDVQSMKQFLSAEEFGHVQQNIRTLRAVLRDTGATFLDLSTLLPGGDFDHPRADPHEHLRSTGRLKCVRKLAEAVQQLEGQG